MSELGERLIDFSDSPGVVTLGRHSQSNNWFEISTDGFKRGNLGRPMGPLIREAVANSLDLENVTEINVEIDESHAVIEDNSAGFSNPDLAFTVFLTDKESSHLKRGRKGRGLKELVSAGYKSIIETVGYTITFDDKGRLVEHNNRTSGTKIEVFSNSPNWLNPHHLDAIELVRSIIPPTGVTITVNKEEIKHLDHFIELWRALPTVTIREGVEVLTNVSGYIHLYKKNGAQGKVHELGIPVEAIPQLPFHIDVQMRIPLNDARDSVEKTYLNEKLLPTILKEILKESSILPTSCLYDAWVLEALKHLGYDEKAAFSDRLLQEFSPSKKQVVRKSKTAKANAIAEQLGYEVVDLDHLPEAVLEHLYVTDALTVARQADTKTEKPVVLNYEQQSFVSNLNWLLTKAFPDMRVSNSLISRETVDDKPIALSHESANGKITFKWNINAGLPFHKPFAKIIMALTIREMEAIYRARSDYSTTSAHIGAYLLEAMATKAKSLTGTTFKQAKTVIINCEDCGDQREIKVQDKFQVSRCVVCQQKYAAVRAKARRDLVKKLAGEL